MSASATQGGHKNICSHFQSWDCRNSIICFFCYGKWVPAKVLWCSAAGE